MKQYELTIRFGATTKPQEVALALMAIGATLDATVTDGDIDFRTIDTCEL